MWGFLACPVGEARLGRLYEADLTIFVRTAESKNGGEHARWGSGPPGDRGEEKRGGSASEEAREKVMAREGEAE